MNVAQRHYKHEHNVAFLLTEFGYQTYKMTMSCEDAVQTPCTEKG